MDKPKARVLDFDAVHSAGTLTIEQRLMWTVIIARLADDQGRLLDDSRNIRFEAFASDARIKAADVERGLVALARVGKIKRYKSRRLRLIQIAGWWALQRKMMWASPSIYPPPLGWKDRIRYHAKGNRIEKDNWDDAGDGTKEPST